MESLRFLRVAKLRHSVSTETFALDYVEILLDLSIHVRVVNVAANWTRVVSAHISLFTKRCLRVVKVADRCALLVDEVIVMEVDGSRHEANLDRLLQPRNSDVVEVLAERL